MWKYIWAFASKQSKGELAVPHTLTSSWRTLATLISFQISFQESLTQKSWLTPWLNIPRNGARSVQTNSIYYRGIKDWGKLLQAVSHINKIKKLGEAWKDTCEMFYWKSDAERHKVTCNCFFLSNNNVSQCLKKVSIESIQK